MAISKCSEFKISFDDKKGAKDKVIFSKDILLKCTSWKKRGINCCDNGDDDMKA